MRRHNEATKQHQRLGLKEWLQRSGRTPIAILAEEGQSQDDFRPRRSDFRIVRDDTRIVRDGFRYARVNFNVEKVDFRPYRVYFMYGGA